MSVRPHIFTADTGTRELTHTHAHARTHLPHEPACGISAIQHAVGDIHARRRDVRMRVPQHLHTAAQGRREEGQGLAECAALVQQDPQRVRGADAVWVGLPVQRAADGKNFRVRTCGGDGVAKVCVAGGEVQQCGGGVGVHGPTQIPAGRYQLCASVCNVRQRETDRACVSVCVCVFDLISCVDLKKTQTKVILREKQQGR